MKKWLPILVLLATVCMPLNAVALPTLYFDGALEYTFDGTNGLLRIDATLVGYEDLLVQPLLPGTLDLEAAFIAEIPDPYRPDLFTAGLFGPRAGGELVPDFQVYGGDNAYLLGGGVEELVMRGRTGRDRGQLIGTIAPLEGTLLSHFGNPSDFVTVVLNLTSDFGPGMFGQDISGNFSTGVIDFSGDIDGHLDSPVWPIPEPATVTLVGLGVLSFLGFVRRYS
jgi:hypothetical protein